MHHMGELTVTGHMNTMVDFGCQVNSGKIAINKRLGKVTIATQQISEVKLMALGLK